MTEFLLKSILCMTVFFGLYRLLLEREKMHRFNRHYLRLALIFSLAIPFINLPIYSKTITPAIVTLLPLIVKSDPAVAQPKSLLNSLLAVAYATVTLTLAVRFIKNIYFFSDKIKKNEKVEYKGAMLVLVKEKVLPHTFLNFIFVNRKDFLTDSIENELYAHELAHVKQRHTLDILFIEALRVVFWFNPLLYLYKKAIQLNHEFLADEQAIAQSGNAIPYQNLLLEKASHKHVVELASNFNFSVTKKRMIMMTKNTPRLQACARQVALIPAIVALFMISCSQTEDQSTKTAKPDSNVVMSNDALIKQPEFPGGLNSFYEQIVNNFTAPEVDQDVTARIPVSFVIEKDGSISSVKATKDPGYGLAEEAERVVGSISTKWTPGEEDGKPVRTMYTLPIVVNIKG